MQASHAVAATIYEVEPLGGFTVVALSVGDSVLRAQITGQPQFTLGEPVHLSLALDKCHLFASADGARIATGATG